jgi:hypothetical protein
MNIKNDQFRNKYSATTEKSAHTRKKKSFNNQMQLVAEKNLPFHVCASFIRQMF